MPPCAARRAQFRGRAVDNGDRGAEASVRESAGRSREQRSADCSSSGEQRSAGSDTPILDAQQQQNPYPYNPAEAVSLLTAHGWKVVSQGTDTCTRPGSGPTDCGAGIPSGAKMAFNFLYATGTQAGNEEDAALQSSFSQAGINLSLSGQSFDNVRGLCNGHQGH